MMLGGRRSIRSNDGPFQYRQTVFVIAESMSATPISAALRDPRVRFTLAIPKDLAFSIQCE